MGTLNKNLFASDISEVFKMDNSFATLLPNYQEYVNNATIVLPNVGSYSATQVAKNTTSWPLTDTLTRTDVAKTITMNAFQLKPIVLSDPIEDAEFNYSKRLSVYGESIKNLKEEINNNYFLDLINTVATGSTVVIASSGSGRTCLSEDQTGNRKAITLEDIQKLARLFNKQNLSKEGRILVVPSDLEFDIVNLSGFKYTDELNRQVMVDGFIGKVSGFQVFSRGKVLVTTSGGTIKSTQDIDSTDNLCAIAFHTSCVGKADGAIDTFERVDDPYYMSTIISANVRSKAFNKYVSEIGVGYIYESAV